MASCCSPLNSVGLDGVGGTCAEPLTGPLPCLWMLAAVLGGRMESKCRWRLC